MKTLSQARIAIVHEWLVTYAGSERVLEQMLIAFPQADLFSIVDFVPERERAFLGGRTPTTSFVQRLPGARRRYRHYLPLMPLAVEQFDLSAYDVVISSSHCVAKGVLTGPDQLHLCMCYSPIRYAWDLQHQYLKESGLERGPLSWIARALLHRMRLWDSRTASGVDEFIAISEFIRRRIRKVYGRASSVIYPPVDTAAFPMRERKEDFYLTASRMVPYKRMDVLVDAFARMPERRLVVIGSGPEEDRLRARAPGNVEFLGHQPFPVLRDHLQRAQAFLFAAEEDFGIVVLEAQACGTPVIAFGKGGALETVRHERQPGPTGTFFYEQTPEAVAAAVDRFEANRARFTAEAAHANAQRFGTERFQDELRALVEECYNGFQRERAGTSSTAPRALTVVASSA
jgi:glycosyltransferase involved in cell wall biosynthesis